MKRVADHGIIGWLRRAWWMGCAAWVLLVSVPTEAFAAADEPPRVAIVTASEQEQTAQRLTDMAVARLSEMPDVTVVERERIDQLLTEQEMSAAGLVEADSALRLGELAGADLVVVIEMDPERERAIAAVIFDATHGLRLWDGLFAGDDPFEQAGTLVAAVEQGREKWRMPSDRRLTLCFLPARNADLSRAYDPVAEAISRLIERRLLASDYVVLLERSRLEHLRQEQRLSTDRDQDLLGSVLLATVELRRGDADGLEASAVVESIDREAGGHFEAHSSERDTPLALADELAARLTAMLSDGEGAAPVKQQSDVKMEAYRFAREGWMLYNRGRYTAALEALEAANALAPGVPAFENPLAVVLMVQAKALLADDDAPRTRPYWRAYHRMWQPDPVNLNDALSLIERATALEIFWSARRPTEGPYRRHEPHPRWDRPAEIPRRGGLIRFHGNRLWPLLDMINPSSEAAARSLQTLRDRLNAIHVERLKRIAQLIADETSHNELIYLSSTLRGVLTQMERSTPFIATTDEQLASISTLYVSEVAAALETLPKDWHGHASRVRELRQLFERQLQGFLMRPAGSSPGGERIEPFVHDTSALRIPWRQTLQPFYDGLHGHEHPGIDMLARASSICLDWNEGKLDKAALDAALDELWTVGIERLEAESPWIKEARGDALWHAYDMVLLYPARHEGGGLSVNDDYLEWVIPHYRRLLDAMRSHRQFPEKVIKRTLRWLTAPAAKSHHADLYQFLTQWPRKLQQDGYVNRIHHPGVLERMAMRMQERLLESSPELATDKGERAWHDVAVLFEVDREKDERIVAAGVVDGGALIVVRDDGAYVTYRVPLPGGQAHRLHASPVTTDVPTSNYTLDHRAISSDYAVLCIGDGVYIVRLRDGETWLWSPDGYDSDRNVGAIGILGDTLYLSLDGPGQLLAHDLASDEMRVLASAQRRVMQSPLDNVPELEIGGLIPDPDRERMLFTASVAPSAHVPGRYDERNALWSYHPDEQRFDRIEGLYRRFRLAGYGTGNVIFLRRDFGNTLARLDPNADAVSFVRASGVSRARTLGPQFLNNDIQPEILAQPLAEPYAQIDDEIWNGATWSRWSASQKRDMPLAAPIEGESAAQDYHTLQPLDGGARLLIANRHHVLLLELDEADE